MDELNKDRIETILKFITNVEKDLDGVSLEEYQQSDLLVRATCFSLVQIGEQMNRLETKIGKEYPDIPWSEAVKLRNLIVHVYSHVKSEIIYNVIKNDLPELKKSFMNIIQSL